MTSCISTKTPPSTNTQPVYILGFFDRLVQRIKNIINESWIIPNPNNFKLNIVNTIIFQINVTKIFQKNDSEKPEIEKQELQELGVEDPKIIASLQTPKERAVKIISIAKQLQSRLRNEIDLNISTTNEICKKTTSLDQCIQMVCSYAFKSWMLNSTKEKLSEEIRNSLNPESKDEITLTEEDSTRTVAQIVEKRSPSLPLSSNESEVDETSIQSKEIRNSLNPESKDEITLTEEDSTRTVAQIVGAKSPSSPLSSNESEVDETSTQTDQSQKSQKHRKTQEKTKSTQRKLLREKTIAQRLIGKNSKFKLVLTVKKRIGKW